MPEPRREELVTAAFGLLAKSGFEGLRTRDVAAAVGVNVATLHYYFPSKEDLIRAVVGRAMSRFQVTLESDGTSAQRLRGHLRGLRRLAREEPEVFAVMAELWIRAARDPDLATVIAKMHDYWLSTLRTLLRDARASGELREGVDPDGAAAVIVATLRGAFLLPGHRSTENVDRTIRQLEDLVSRGSGV